jgi:hypothetical protein
MEEGLPDWIAYVIIGVVVMGVAYWKFGLSLAFRLRGRKTNGVIVNWMMTREKGVSYFYPVIEFYTEKGEQIRLRADERCEAEPLYEQGTGVVVHYLPDDSKTVRIVYPDIKK